MCSSDLQVTEGLDLSGRTLLVTGVASGLGQETMRILAKRGARVVGLARTEAKVRDAAKEVGVDVVPVACDLSEPASVRAAVSAVRGQVGPLDGLIANAGIMATPFALSVDGFESQFAVDHLGHFLLVRELLPMLADSAPARVVCVSSAGHRMGDVDLDDLNFERRPYEPFLAYGAAKSSNVLHAVEIDRRWKDRGVQIGRAHV